MTIPTHIPEPGTFDVTLRQVREQRELSQHRLADIAGYDHSFVSRLEMDPTKRSSRRPARETVLNLAAAMDCDELETDTLLIAGGYAPESETMRGVIQRAMDELRYRRIKQQAWEDNRLIVAGKAS